MAIARALRALGPQELCVVVLSFYLLNVAFRSQDDLLASNVNHMNDVWLHSAVPGTGS